MQTLELNENLETMLLCAERYALGRRTYIVGCVTDYIQPLIPSLSTKTLNVLNQDLQTIADKVSRTGMKGLWGDACDERRWLKFWSAVKIEIADRKENNGCNS